MMKPVASWRKAKGSLEFSSVSHREIAFVGDHGQVHTPYAHHFAIIRRILLRMRSWQNFVFLEGH